MKPTALVVHHDGNSQLGGIRTELERRFDLVEHWMCPDDADPTHWEPIPQLDSPSAYVSMGSRWSVNDSRTAPWVHHEAQLIRDLHSNRIPVLGICFGAQLVAYALGGRVEPANQPEIGWYTVTCPGHQLGEGPWFQWHYDSALPPSSATQLASSSSGCQAFAIESTLAVQFHPELDSEILGRWLTDDVAELLQFDIDVAALIEQTTHLQPLSQRNCDHLIRYWLDTAR